jgi:hypothetical protein
VVVVVLGSVGLFFNACNSDKGGAGGGGGLDGGTGSGGGLGPPPDMLGGGGPGPSGDMAAGGGPGPSPDMSATSTLPSPPATWQEHWFEHNQLLKLIDYNDDVAIYYDDDVNRTDAAWQFGFMTKVWHYSRQVYGEMKDSATDGRLYAIYHQNKYGGGHPAYYHSDLHDFRNSTDCGPGPWVESDNYAHDETSHEAGHVVESCNNGKHGSPAFAVWGDSKWMEFFQYDLYLGLGMTSHAQRVFDQFTATTDTFPRAGTHWFRDWFYPLWRDHGHAQVMVTFYQLLAKYFPQNIASDGQGEYSRDMNWGEFVHFMSGAAHTNLLAQAHTAFGPNFPTDAEFAQAQQAFPQVTY